MLEVEDKKVRITRKLRKQLNMTDVSIRIEEIKDEHGLDSYRQACLAFLEECYEPLEFSDLNKLLSQTLRQKLHEEAVRDGFIRQRPKGTLDEFFESEVSV